MAFRVDSIRVLQIALLVVLLDQSSKWVAAARGLIILNPGGALSVGGNHATAVLWVTSAVLLALVLWWPRFPASDRGYLTFILAAGLSNLADRFTLGGVRDFLVLRGLFVFNVADLIMSVAAGLLLLAVLFRPPSRTYPRPNGRG